jgi:hypothetical protein
MVRHHHTTAAVAITLALTAGLASIASADPAPLAQAEAAIAATHSSAPVRPNPDEQTVTGASTAPCSEVCSGGGYGSVPATIVHVVAPDGSFNWGDAGIGAGASLVLVGIGLAGTRAVTNSRKRHTREQRAIATN